MSYRIKISYSTGDSFGCRDEEDYLDLEWEDLEVAKKNLKAIKDHYELYQKLNGRGYDYKNYQSYIEEKSNQWWFVGEKDSSGKWGTITSEHQMKLQADNGNTMQQWNFWCGYFEQLYGAEIEPNNSDLSFEV